MADETVVTTLERFDAFISYSREDGVFVRRLDERLRALNRKTWVDWEAIRPAVEFPSRIRAGIEGAANFVFVISPGSIASEWCGMELGHAVACRKRLIPIRCRAFDPLGLPRALRTLNWIDFDEAEFGSALEALVGVLDTDQPWLDGHARLLMRAVEWNAKTDASFLLRGEDLKDAVRWLGEAGAIKGAQPSPLHIAYIQASQVGQEQELRRWQDLSQKYLAGRLAAEAKLARDESPRLLTRSVLLAIESLRRRPSVEAHEALSESLARLPGALHRVQHASAVDAIAFSPTGAWFASADADGQIQFTDLKAHTLVEPLTHTARVRSLSFSADERLLAVGGDDGAAAVWDLDTRQRRHTFAHDEAVWTVEFAAEGTRLLTATGTPGHPGIVKLWDANDGVALGTIPRASMARFYAGGAVVVSAEASELVFRDVATGTETARLAHDEAVVSFDLSPVKPIIAAATFDGSLWLWTQADEGRIARDRVASGLSRIGPVALSRDGGVVAALRPDSQVGVWDVDTLKEVARLQHGGSAAGVRQLAFDPAGRCIASLSGEDQSVGVWEVATGQPIAGIEQNQARAMCFSPNGELLATASQANAAWVWTRATPAAWAWIAPAGLSRALRFSPDGSCLAWLGRRVHEGGRVSTREGEMLCLFDAATGQAMWSAPHDGAIDAVAFGDDGRSVATSSAAAVRVWDRSNGTETPDRRSEVQYRFVTSAAVPDFASASVSPDTRWFVHAIDTAPGVERVAQTAELRTMADGHALQCELRFDGALTAITWSPDSGSFATGHADGAVRLWDAATGQQTARLEHHIDVVRALAFSPAGDRLASAGDDGAIVAWRARTADLVEAACERLTRNLTPHEWQQYLGDEAYRPTCSSPAEAFSATSGRAHEGDIGLASTPVATAS